MNLYEDTMQMLDAHRKPMLKLAEEMNVSFRYLYKLKNRETCNPRVKDIQKVYDWLLKDKRRKQRQAKIAASAD